MLGLRGVDVDRIYSIASVKDRKSGASRPICQRDVSVHRVSPITATYIRGPPQLSLGRHRPLSADETSIRTIAPSCVLGLQGVDVDRVRPKVS